MVKAIDTSYAGHLFRSRLEARWAVFFDTLRIPWEYEREGYELPSGWYLPDFWLPQQKAWIEIKGKESTGKEETLAGELCLAQQADVFIFAGPLFIPEESRYPWAPHGDWFAPRVDERGHPKLGGDHPYLWCECADCGLLGLQFDGRSDRLPCKEEYLCAVSRADGKVCPLHGGAGCGGCHRSGGNMDKGYNYDSARLVSAYERALSARFEFGAGRV